MDRRTFLRTLQYGALTLSSSVLLPTSALAGRRTESEHYYHRLRQFNSPVTTDVSLSEAELATVRLCVNRLKRLRRTVGYGNFNILSFDMALKVARNYSKVGSFTPSELNLLEQLFYENATHYGFYGQKVLTNITATIPKKETYKVAGSGHYLFKGDSLTAFERIQRDVAGDLILTSGIRGIVKQMHLFLDKTLRLGGNLSLASRSLAPPGYSYHGISDFDVGKRGWGTANFTEAFATTEEYKRLVRLGYVKLRYPEGNPFGVRYEPWHITVVQG